MNRIADRLRSDEPFSEKLNEAAAEELDRLESDLSAAYAELRKQHPTIKAVFDREVWAKADSASVQDVMPTPGANADTERMNYVCSVTRCDPKMDGNHVYFGIGGRPLKGSTLRQAIDKELVRLYGKAEMPRAENAAD